MNDVKNHIIAALASLLVIVAIATYFMGRNAGIRHAIYDAEIWTVERYDPDDPDSTLRPDGYDQTIYIDLDGMTYEHGMHQG